MTRLESTLAARDAELAHLKAQAAVLKADNSHLRAAAHRGCDHPTYEERLLAVIADRRTDPTGFADGCVI